jgi:hypothetical protein
MLVGPPNIKPARLFRLLLQRPRATASLDVPGFGVMLEVRAISAAEEAEIAESVDGLDRERVVVRAAAELLMRAVWSDGAPAFSSMSDVDGLYPHEVLAMARATRASLDAISPTYSGRFDVTAWRHALIRGAKDASNITLAMALGGCVDVTYGYAVRHTIERPDRYFGVPIADLTDGQLMAYRAAREVYMEHTKK